MPALEGLFWDAKNSTNSERVMVALLNNKALL